MPARLYLVLGLLCALLLAHAGARVVFDLTAPWASPVRLGLSLLASLWLTHLCWPLRVGRQRPLAPPAPEGKVNVAAVVSDDPRRWRVSGSGYAIQTGGGNLQRSVAEAPLSCRAEPPNHRLLNLWREEAQRECDRHNATLASAPPAALTSAEDKPMLTPCTICGSALGCAHRPYASPANEELERLRAFARRVMQPWPEGGLDGDELQEAAVEAGILLPEERTAPCGESCGCAEFHGGIEGMADGVTCYRKVAWLLAAPPPPRPGADETGD